MLFSFQIILLVFLICISALVSGSEIAFFTLNSEQLEKCKSSSKGSDRRIIDLINKPKQLLATILILNNLINVGIVILTTFVFKGDGFLIWFIRTVAAAFAIVLFGEIVPKVLATKKNLQFARVTVTGLYFSQVVFKPFSWILMILGSKLEAKIKNKGYSASVNEIQEAVELSTKQQTDEEREILKGIVNFGTINVKQIMTSRLDITAFNIDYDFHTLMDKINKCGFSRIPIYKDTIDKIEGVLYVKDLLNFRDQDENFRWQEHIRSDVFFVHESKKIDSLFKDFQRKRVHMALVVDEYGGTSGLVSMEDVIEEIMGEINDEYDGEELKVKYKQIDFNTFTFESKISINDFAKIINVDTNIFSEAKGESESLGGLLLELFAKLPNSGEKIEFENILFTVVGVDKKRIKTIRVNTSKIKKLQENSQNQEL